MIIEQVTDLGEDAIKNPQKYNAFMGISILHRFFSPKRIHHYFEWCTSQFKETVILLMDDPDQHNFVVFKQLPPDEALAKARIISDEIKRSYEKTLSKLSISNIKVVQFRDFIHNHNYQTILSTIYEFVKENKEFKYDLVKLMEGSIKGKVEEFAKQHNLNARHLLCTDQTLFKYIVEEISSIIYFTKQEYLIELDPTIEFKTKKMLYEGHFPDLYKHLSLHSRGHIYVHPKGITKSTY